MKKLTIFLILLFVFPAITLAAVMNSGGNKFYLNQSKEILPISITAESDDEITAEHGINIIINGYDEILWNDLGNVTATGTAVDNGRVASEVMPVYSNGYRTLHIPVLQNFLGGEEVLINGLAMKIYDETIGQRSLLLDIDGDLAHDVVDSANYWVSDAKTYTDTTPTYPPSDFEAEVADDFSSVVLTWQHPADYDFVSHTMKRNIIRDGKSTLEFVFERWGSVSYTDINVQEGDIITYELYSLDNRNSSEPAIVEVELVSAEEPVACCMAMTASCLACTKGITEEEYCAQYNDAVDCPVADEDEETEMEMLDRLFNYYGIRYSIKCMPRGIPAPESSSACLWARIDLVYAQELLERDDVDASLSDRDKELMAKRVKYPEQRYQDNCVETSEPASYCSSLNKALQRIHYFID